MMTDLQKELAARKLCALRGIDPDAMIAHAADSLSNGMVPAICLYSPAWQLAAREIEKHERIEEAMTFGRSVE